jgi:hypothetical protein
VSASTPDSTAQLGIAQLGIAQLGDASLAGSRARAIDGSNQGPQGAIATPLSAGALITGGLGPHRLRGDTTAVLEAIATPFAAGAQINGGSKVASKARGRGFWPWAPTKVEFDLLMEHIPER